MQLAPASMNHANASSRFIPASTEDPVVRELDEDGFVVWRLANTPIALVLGLSKARELSVKGFVGNYGSVFILHLASAFCVQILGIVSFMLVLPAWVFALAATIVSFHAMIIMVVTVDFHIARKILLSSFALGTLATAVVGSVSISACLQFDGRSALVLWMPTITCWNLLQGALPKNLREGRLVRIAFPLTQVVVISLLIIIIYLGRLPGYADVTIMLGNLGGLSTSSLTFSLSQFGTSALLAYVLLSATHINIFKQTGKRGDRLFRMFVPLYGRDSDEDKDIYEPLVAFL